MSILEYCKKFITGIILVEVCLFSNNVIADCAPDTSKYTPDCDSTANLHYPTITAPNYQGSAKTDSFDCAVNGRKQLSIEQINERSDLIPPKLTNRFYIRLGANAAAEGISGASIKGVNNTTTNLTGTLQNKSIKVADNNFEMAVGYTWSEFAVDLEWLASKSVTYSSFVYGAPPTFTINSNVKGDALLINTYWIFQNLYNVNAYADFIVGWSNNSNTSYINAGPITATRWYHWAFGLGVGGRFNIVSRLFADVKGRYIFLGTTRLIATNNPSYAYIKVNRTWMGASVCLLWLI